MSQSVSPRGSIEYRISYTSQGGDTEKTDVQGNVTTYNLTNLNKYTTYNITVSVVHKGAVIATSSNTVTTWEDGMLFLIVYQLISHIRYSHSIDFVVVYVCFEALLVACKK